MRNLLLLAILVAAHAAAPGVSAEEESGQTPDPSASITVDCDRKRVTCGGLQTCTQACGFLNQCSAASLDRDKDGIPCESLCSKPCDTPG